MQMFVTNHVRRKRLVTPTDMLRSDEVMDDFKRKLRDALGVVKTINVESVDAWIPEDIEVPHRSFCGSSQIS